MTSEHEMQIREEIREEIFRGEWEWPEEDDVLGECENCSDPIHEKDDDVIGVLDADLKPHFICSDCAQTMSAGDLFELCGNYWHVGDWREVSAALGSHAEQCRRIRRGASA